MSDIALELTRLLDPLGNDTRSAKRCGNYVRVLDGVSAALYRTGEARKLASEWQRHLRRVTRMPRNSMVRQYLECNAYSLACNQAQAIHQNALSPHVRQRLAKVFECSPITLTWGW